MAAAMVVAAGAQETDRPQAQEGAPTVLQLRVRRVLVDVSVTDAKGMPVAGLTRKDFRVLEDGRPQKIVAFDANGFGDGMAYVPPALPKEPPNTFLDLPREPEKGPLYVLLLDLVNMDSPDQMNSPMDHRTQLFARPEVVKFIESKPEGTRFAVFVRSDGLHLVQGFTADKALLERAVDPHFPRKHLPAVFLMGANMGRGDRISALNTLHAIAEYLDGLQGRKNLIWFAAQFPISLFPDETDAPRFQEETKATLDMLAREQIAVYPVDARGVPYGDSHTQLATSVHSDTITSPIEAGSGTTGAGSGPVGTGPSTMSSYVEGKSTTMGSYDTMDELARETGGRAFYGDNDVAAELVKATASGEMYYTLGYAPTAPDDDAKLRHIRVELVGRPGDVLSYRRSYYGLKPVEGTAAGTEATDTEVAGTIPAGAMTLGEPAPVGEPRKEGDSLSANMEHGAPEMHELVFVVQAKPVGAPVMGTPEQMAALATEPAYFVSRKKGKPAKAMAAVPLQMDELNFEIPSRQFDGEAELHLELAAAAYDSEGRMMNAFVRVAEKKMTAGTNQEALFLRVQQDIEVPQGAAWLRFAVRDVTNNRVGAMEIPLPLAPASTGVVPTGR